MKIEKIILCNLTSIEGEQVIDFTAEPLRSSGLFAITGDTGSGKSTILDAICLALYNKAPRFENIERMSADDLKLVADKAQQIQAGNVAGILRRGQRQGGVTVVFSTHDGERYEAEWNIRVTRTGSYAKPERTLRQTAPRKRTVDKQSIQTELETAIGLSYEQFTRTVILAQNSFSNFLRAKVADKAVLLEKLTGTEVYGAISEQIYRYTNDAGIRVRDLENRMEGMLHDRLAPEALAEEKERQRLLSARRDAVRHTLEQTERQLAWLDRLDEAVRTVKQCEKDFADTTKACMKMRAEELQLERYDALLDMQPLFQEITMRAADIQSVKDKETGTVAAIETVCKDLEQASSRLGTARERTVEAEAHQEMRAAVINKGYALTGEVTVAKEELKRQEVLMKAAESTLGNRQKHLRDRQEVLRATSGLIEEKSLHKQSLAVHRTMFDKFDLVKDKLSMLLNETTDNKEYHERLQTLNHKRELLKEKISTAEQQKDRQQAGLNALKSELLIHRQANQGRDSVLLQKEAAGNRNRLDALRRASVLWQHISEGYVRIADRRAAQRREETELGRKHQEAEKALLALAAAEEAYERISTAYTLSNSENIVQLRKQLKEGTACPVCGATHHPYHTETERELGELLTNLSKDYQEMQETLAARRRTLGVLREEIAADDARIKAGREALADMEERQQADMDEWQNFAYLDKSFADCSPSVNRDARAVMIQLLIDNTTRSADEADTALDTFNFHQGHINTLNEKISSLESEMADNQTFLQKITTEAQIVAATVAELQRKINISDHAYSETYTDLDDMVTLSGWFAAWKSNPDTFRRRLTGLYQDWLATSTALDEAERSAALLAEEIKGAAVQVDEAQRTLTAYRDSRDAIREALSRKQEELTRLFGTATPQEEADALRQRIAEARAAEQKLQADYDRLQGDLKRLEGQRENLEKSRVESLKLLQERQQRLDLMILRFNGTNSPVQFAELEQLFSDTRDWKSLRVRLDALHKAHLLSQNRLTQARDALLAIKAEPGRPEAEDETQRIQLASELKVARETLAEVSDALSVTNSRLLSHDNCVRRAAQLESRLAEARSDYEEWSRLNILFGSADGKKFRTLAQSYTFAYLVRHANCHLRQLSPRYELCNIPGTLNLEIIDRDMFDEHRYVTSLSGGETFVVSLALALGLASMSGAGLAIGSLFIDEGFGNLDKESLDIVMLALSNLENVQGRKVGVISHTDRVRSQISPQIKLRKVPGGNRSVIEIR